MGVKKKGEKGGAGVCRGKGVLTFKLNSRDWKGVTVLGWEGIDICHVNSTVGTGKGAMSWGWRDICQKHAFAPPPPPPTLKCRERAVSTSVTPQKVTSAAEAVLWVPPQGTDIEIKQWGLEMGQGLRVGGY